MNKVWILAIYIIYTVHDIIMCKIIPCKDGLNNKKKFINNKSRN